MKLIKFIGAVIAIAIITSCGQNKKNDVQKDIPDGWITFEHKDYSIQFPDSFEYKKIKFMKLKYQL